MYSLRRWVLGDLDVVVMVTVEVTVEVTVSANFKLIYELTGRRGSSVRAVIFH